MRFLAWALTLAAVGAGTAGTAQTVLDRFDISINAEDEADQGRIVTLATTFAMLAPQTSGLRKASRLEFRSGTGLIEDDTASDKLRALLPEQLGLSADQLTAMRSPCDISRHRFDDVDVLLAVHDSAGAQPEDAQRCFVAALWIYHSGGDSGVTVDNWRVPYARIVGSVASGQPAYGGAPAEEK